MLSRFLLIRRRLQSSLDTKPILIQSEPRWVLPALGAGVEPASSSVDITPPVSAVSDALVANTCSSAQSDTTEYSTTKTTDHNDDDNDDVERGGGENDQ
ncbi:hypothetical protein Aduo_000400 [Ancylostoma duodenale]